jgi:protein SCO1/2
VSHPLRTPFHGIRKLTGSIFFYLMDPLGQFVDAFGKNTTADEVATKTKEAMVKWEKAGGNAAAGVPEKQT